VINVGDLVDGYVSKVRALDGLLALLGSGIGIEAISAYHDHYPDVTQIQLAIQKMTPPAILVVYGGTGRGNIDGVAVPSHRLIAYLKLVENQYEIISLLVDGIVLPSGEKICYAEMHSGCDPMTDGIATVDRVPTILEGQPDFFVVQASFNEKGFQ
jgi:hypothetical protein